MNGKLLWAISLVALSVAARAASAAEPADATVIATVGDDPITAADVQRIIDAIPANRRPSGDALPMTRAIALEEVVNRWLVIAYARHNGDEPSAEELATAKKKLQVRLSAKGGAPDADSGSDAELERQALWRLIWDRYLTKYRTPEHRQSWFAAHHRDVDGTQLVVSHILLRPGAEAGPKEIDALDKQSAAIRAEIASGAIDFARAAAKYSGAPSAKQGGRLGKISRHGPMEETFSRAAFALEAGQISPPLRTRFGVDLIRCDEVIAGTKQIADVKDAIDDALAKELLDKISSYEREKSPVKYTGAWPHLKPGTQELVK